jgi:hypothetical protein
MIFLATFVAAFCTGWVIAAVITRLLVGEMKLPGLLWTLAVSP